MRFLLDHCIARAVGRFLQEAGHDVATVTERDPRASDATILSWAADEGRVVVTIDQDFGNLVFVEGRAHAGIIRIADGRGSDQVAMIRSALADLDDDVSGAVVVVDGKGRVRKSRGPVGNEAGANRSGEAS